MIFELRMVRPKWGGGAYSSKLGVRNVSTPTICTGSCCRWREASFQAIIERSFGSRRRLGASARNRGEAPRGNWSYGERSRFIRFGRL